MFKCNLTGAEYTYENMNLLELRNKMLQQFGLKPWDIYAGYVENSKMDYTPNEIEVSAKDTPWKLQLASNIGKRIADTETRRQQDIDELTAKIASLNLEILKIAKENTGVELSTYEEYRHQFGIKLAIPSKLTGSVHALERELYAVKYTSQGYKTEILPEDLDLFEDTDLFLAKIVNCIRPAVLTADSLLRKFDYRKMVCILDYCERNQLSNEEKLRAFKVDMTEDYAVQIDSFKLGDYSEKPVDMYNVGDNYAYGLYKKITPEELYEYIVTQLNTYAEKVVEVNRDVYYQQVDITPITINITLEGKLELIDGYKRLLYVNDPELLNVDAPIKVFKELSDEAFIRLLSSANAWKTVDTGWNKTNPYHDRGYIFALRQRFGIRFEDYFHDTWKDIDLLELLQIYDAPKNHFVYNKYLAADMKALAHLDLITMSFFKNEDNQIYHRVIKSVISILGKTRRNNLDKEQNALDFNKFIEQVLSDKAFAKKLASKENLSVGGHIDNFMGEHVVHVLRKAMESALLSK